MKITVDTIKKMLKEAYIAGYEGPIDLAEEEAEAIYNKYIAEQSKLESRAKTLYSSNIYNDYNDLDNRIYNSLSDIVGSSFQ